MSTPYTQERNGIVILREFSEFVDDSELVWHRDHVERVVVPLECDGWMFQRDNEPPVEMEPFKAFVIEKDAYHRIIKGSGTLRLKIVEGK